VKDHLDFNDYVRFWGGLLDRPSVSRGGFTPMAPSRSPADALAS
jgi:hypothetical protein